MKNTIPLVFAVVFGLAAVFGVSRFIASRTAEAEKNYVDVVAAARDIVVKDGEIKASWIMKKKVEISSLPAKAILWTQANSVLGQTVTRTERPFISRQMFVRLIGLPVCVTKILPETIPCFAA